MLIIIKSIRNWRRIKVFRQAESTTSQSRLVENRGVSNSAPGGVANEMWTYFVIFFRWLVQQGNVVSGKSHTITARGFDEKKQVKVNDDRERDVNSNFPFTSNKKLFLTKAFLAKTKALVWVFLLQNFIFFFCRLIWSGFISLTCSLILQSTMLIISFFQIQYYNAEENISKI